MDLGFADAATVVVGGGSGMGFATAQCLAEDGARVAVVGRRRDVLERAAADLERRGSPDAVAVVADAGDDNSVQRAFADIGDRWGGELNALINTVGPGAAGNFEELTDERAAQLLAERRAKGPAGKPAGRRKPARGRKPAGG